MDYQALQQKALEIRRLYAGWEQKKYGRSWTSEEIALGFVGDVGDLAKLIGAMNGVRDIPDAREKIAHELADCLWSIIVLSDQLGIDLETSFWKTMDELELHIRKQKV